MAVTREQFQEWLKAAGGSDERARQDAERRLSMLPRAFILEHLPPLWTEAEETQRNRERLGIGITFAAVFLCLSGLSLKYWLRREGTSIDLPFPFLFFFLGPFQSATLSRKPEFTGFLHVLMQHRYPALAPLLIEALPAARKACAANKNSAIRHGEIMGALASLLPRYAAQDLPDLTERQTRILRDELKRYNRKLRDADAMLTTEEGAFLAAVLAFLRRARRKTDDARTAKIVENLAIERVEPALERREHRQVREAARQAMVRLYG